MKEELLNNGVDAVETRQINKSALYFGLLIVTGVVAIVSLGINVRNSVVETNLEYQIKQRDSLINDYVSQIDELTYNAIQSCQK
jgi:hypothetical protein